MERKIAAIWIVNDKRVWISHCGKYWYGDSAEHSEAYHVGDTQHAWNEITLPYTISPWKEIYQSLVDMELGEPIEGRDPRIPLVYPVFPENYCCRFCLLEE